MQNGDEFFMRQALDEARKAFNKGEVPIGAVVVYGDRIVGRGHNLTETLADPTAHAEMLVLREGARVMKNHRLAETTLYVTLEPCPMCAGAIVNARIPRVYYGARDEAMGACGGVLNLFMESFPFRPALVGGILKDECRAVLADFFRALR